MREVQPVRTAIRRKPETEAMKRRREFTRDLAVKQYMRQGAPRNEAEKMFAEHGVYARPRYRVR